MLRHQYLIHWQYDLSALAAKEYPHRLLKKIDKIIVNKLFLNIR